MTAVLCLIKCSGIFYFFIEYPHLIFFSLFPLSHAAFWKRMKKSQSNYMFGRRKKLLSIGIFWVKLMDYSGLRIFLIFSGRCQTGGEGVTCYTAPAVVSSLYIGSLVLAGPALSVILNVRYFDKNSAKCGIKYIKSILNTAILYYISPLSHTRMFTQFFVWSYFVDSRKIKFYWCHWDLSCSGAEVFLLKCFVLDKWAMTFPRRRGVMRT